jgi:hypothetical protein
VCRSTGNNWGTVLSRYVLYVGQDDPLSRLPYAENAAFNSIASQHESICLPGTRVDLLNEIYNWADGQDSRCTFWLNGFAGTGKSTIAHTVARRYDEQQRLAASFFFSKSDRDVGRAGLFVTSIAVQLAQNIPASRQHVCDAVTARSHIASQTLRDQWRHIVLEPLSKLDETSSYILVVDALDECEDVRNVQMIVQLLAEARSQERVRLRVLLTSRPEVPIRHGFSEIPDVQYQDFVLHRIQSSIVDNDINIFIKDELRQIAQKHRLHDSWPDARDIAQLVQNACGLFIWAATACRFIHKGAKRQIIQGRLGAILQSGASISEPEEHLHGIYMTVLTSSIPDTLTAREKEWLFLQTRYILGSIVVLRSPLSVYSFCNLLAREDVLLNEDIEDILDNLHAILDIPEDQGNPLRLHHPSFRDFLLDRQRCDDTNFWVDEKQAHQTLAENCIGLMSRTLKQDMCNFNKPGTLVVDAQRDQVKQFVPPEVQYACLYWVEHLAKSGTQLCDDDQVHHFLQEHFLHWLEALGWIQKFSDGIHAITVLQTLATVSTHTALHGFTLTVQQVKYMLISFSLHR